MMNKQIEKNIRTLTFQKHINELLHEEAEKSMINYSRFQNCDFLKHIQHFILMFFQLLINYYIITFYM